MLIGSIRYKTDLLQSIAIAKVATID